MDDTTGLRITGIMGPWKVDDAKDLPLAVIEDTEDGVGIVEVGLPGTQREFASPEEMDIAKLIAAAPQLLRALQLAIRALKDHDIDESMAGEFEILTDAIAEATGQ